MRLDTGSAARLDEEGIIEWLRGAQKQWRAYVEALEDDSELLKVRPSPFGDTR